MTNAAIADYLSLLSDLMELHGQNSFRAKSYSIAAFQIKKAEQPLALMSKAELYAQKNIGEAVGNKIIELINTGHLQVLDDLIAQTPAGVLEMLQVKGIGPKKVFVLWTQLQIENISDLELAAVENRLVDVKGFGAKTQQKILESISFLRQSAGFALYVHALIMSKEAQQLFLHTCPQCTLTTCGALARQEDTISTIDYLTNAGMAQLRDFAKAIPEAMLTQEEDFIKITSPTWLPLHFYQSDGSQWGVQLLKHNSTEGFYKAFTTQYTLPSVAKDEEEIFNAHQLQYIPAALRHNEAYLAQAAAHQLPVLIQPTDIKGLIHCHSTYSDGTATLQEMANACISKGLQYMVISDHSRSASYAGGLSNEKVKQQHEEIDKLNEQLAPFKIFKSIESDILGDGALDYEEELLASFDLVIASVHSNLSMNEDKAMQRLLAAIANKHTRILGHPTGRLLLSRSGYPVDHKAIIDACAQHQVAIEINANPRRLDLDWTHIPYAVEKGVLLSINPDAHSIEGIDDTKYGVWAAQKGGLTSSHNLSSFTLDAFEKFLASRTN